MIKLLSILSIIFMFSCYSLLSDFEEAEEILSYTYYINEGWNAFETINLSDTLSIDKHDEYYQLALEMFDVSLQAINFEFTDQNFLAPKYKSFNGKAWTQLYYAGEFLNPEDNYIKDSLRQESKMYFDQALNDLTNSLFDDISNQDWCDTYLGLTYVHYNLGFENIIHLDTSLIYSQEVLDRKPLYSFVHDELDYKNIHYLRGKIYLQKNMYEEAYYEIQKALESCNAMVDDSVDIDLLLQCFDDFANTNE